MSHVVYDFLMTFAIYFSSNHSMKELFHGIVSMNVVARKAVSFRKAT